MASRKKFLFPGGNALRAVLSIFILCPFWVSLVFAAPSQRDAGSGAAAKLIRGKGCDGCHRFSPEEPGGAAKGPDLFFSGNKFQKEWLTEFLQKPVVIRKAGYITDPGFLEGKPAAPQPHAALPPAEARTAAEYLLSLKLPEFSEGVVDGEPLSKASRAKIKTLFERNYGCSACHEAVNLAGKTHGGVSGPSLVDAGNRLTADWIFHWLKEPGKFLEKGRMPRFKLEDDEIVKLAKYVMTMKKENLK